MTPDKPTDEELIEAKRKFQEMKDEVLIQETIDESGIYESCLGEVKEALNRLNPKKNEQHKGEIEALKGEIDTLDELHREKNKEIEELKRGCKECDEHIVGIEIGKKYATQNFAKMLDGEIVDLKKLEKKLKKDYNKLISTKSFEWADAVEAVEKWNKVRGKIEALKDLKQKIKDDLGLE